MRDPLKDNVSPILKDEFDLKQLEVIYIPKITKPKTNFRKMPDSLKHT